jgi:hypothetical protein
MDGKVVELVVGKLEWMGVLGFLKLIVGIFRTLRFTWASWCASIS